MSPLSLVLALGSLFLGSPRPASAPVPAPLATVQAAPASPFVGCPAPTGASATVLIPALPDLASPSGSLETGDVLAVYAGGTCVGQGTWDGVALALTVWADDPYTAERDGFVQGEPLQIQVWDASTGEAHGDGVAVAFEDGFDATAGLVWDRVYVVSEAAATAGEDGPLAGGVEVGMPFPNPTVGGARLSVRCATPQRVTAEVYDAVGRRVGRVSEQTVSGPAELDVDTRGLAPGVYVVRVAGETFAETRRLTVAR